jgi:anti-sigma regulatory factor (Ser/Thr protein kinase)
MTGLTIATEVNTGALVVTPDGGRGALGRVRLGLAAGIRQRPTALVVDLSRLSGVRAIPALAIGLTRRRSGVAVFARVPAGLRLLCRVPGVTADPVGAVLGTLPLLGRAHSRICARFGPNTDAPGVARALVSEALSTWHMEHLTISAQLIASELVSNAVEHARTEVDFRLLRTAHGLCIAVRDRDPHPPVVPEAIGDGTVSSRGRGLRIVARTAYRWGCLIGTADKIVWAALRDTLARPVEGARAALVAAG